MARGSKAWGPAHALSTSSESPRRTRPAWATVAYTPTFTLWCFAAVRVGERTRARVFPGACRSKCWRIGRRKAAVLPEPVWAVPITSRPERIAGIASRWIVVGASSRVRRPPAGRRGRGRNRGNVVFPASESVRARGHKPSCKIRRNVALHAFPLGRSRPLASRKAGPWRAADTGRARSEFPTIWAATTRTQN